MVKYELIKGLALANSLLSGASLFLWTYNSPFFLILYVIGTIAVSISGILYYYYSKTPIQKIVHVAFGFGVLAWTLILISSIVGVFWNQSNLNMLKSQYSFLFFYYIQDYEINLDLYIIYIAFTFASPNIKELRPFRIGFIGSIIHILITFTGFILGILSLYYSSKDVEYKQERERLEAAMDYIKNSKRIDN